jgi:hypothetical protein
MRVGEFCVASTGGTEGRDREKCGIMHNEEQEYRRMWCLCVCVRGGGGRRPIRALQAYFLCQQFKRLLILFIINARREV